ncbi:NAD-specific glutamate dehydrogenase [Striga asiatica]|uniref:NAD-specific glutamate dehydrogenase n=1 Tax=Striga asiatica TaxID=4170 RepID=A0A5A7R8V2_STRAF|nr:NAD-specific glutamate dehydrogenase [Striga asiatica]
MAAILVSTMDDISLGRNWETTIMGLCVGPGTSLKGHSFMLACTEASLYRLPINRLASAYHPRRKIGEKSCSPKDCVCGIHAGLVNGGFANETLAVGKSDIGWRGAISLIIGYDLDAVVVPHAHA